MGGFVYNFPDNGQNTGQTLVDQFNFDPPALPTRKPHLEGFQRLLLAAFPNQFTRKPPRKLQPQLVERMETVDVAAIHAPPQITPTKVHSLSKVFSLSFHGLRQPLKHPELLREFEQTDFRFRDCRTRSSPTVDEACLELMRKYQYAAVAQEKGEYGEAEKALEEVS